jgi:hypothetical protein
MPASRVSNRAATAFYVWYVAHFKNRRKVKQYLLRRLHPRITHTQVLLDSFAISALPSLSCVMLYVVYSLSLVAKLELQ